MEVKAREYTSRAALDEFIDKLNKTEKAAAVIVGTTAELARLNLSSRTKVHGVPCVPDDFIPRPVTKKPMRGEIIPHGLNGNLKKPKKSQ